MKKVIVALLVLVSMLTGTSKAASYISNISYSSSGVTDYLNVTAYYTCDTDWEIDGGYYTYFWWVDGVAQTTNNYGSGAHHGNQFEHANDNADHAYAVYVYGNYGSYGWSIAGYDQTATPLDIYYYNN